MRNRYGIKDASDCYRTFGGEHYVAWASFPSDARIAAYRKAALWAASLNTGHRPVACQLS